jgi:hypothetical protein
VQESGPSVDMSRGDVSFSSLRQASMGLKSAHRAFLDSSALVAAMGLLLHCSQRIPRHTSSIFFHNLVLPFASCILGSIEPLGSAVITG